MANNPYVNKVQFGNETLIDLTQDVIAFSASSINSLCSDRSDLTTGTILFILF